MSKRILFLLTFSLLSFLSAEAQTYTRIKSGLGNLETVVSPTYLNELEDRLNAIASNSTYDIIVKFDETPVRVTRYPGEMSAQDYQDLSVKIRKKNVKYFKDEILPTATGGRKKIVLFFDFKFYNKPDKNGSLENYFCKTVALSPTTKSYIKTNLSSYNQPGKLLVGEANISANEAYITALIAKIEQLINESSTMSDDNFQFGPLIVNIPAADRIPATGSGSTSGDLRKYTCSNTTVTLTFKTPQYQTLSCTITNASISYFYNDETGAYDQVKITMPGHDPVFLADINILKAYVKDMNLNVTGAGVFSGNVTLQAPVAEDIQLNTLFTCKPGFNGTFVFNYAGTADFSGRYNFSGITGVKIDIAKFGVSIGSLQGNLNADGTITQQVTTANKTCNGGFYTLNLTSFNANVTYSVFTGIKLNSGDLTGSVSSLVGLTGQIGLSASITPVGEINASIVQGGTNLSLCGAVITNLQGGIGMTPDLDFKFFEGTCGLSIPRGGLQSSVQISKIYIDKNGVAEFDGSGTVEFESFTFDIDKLQYMHDAQNNEAIVFSASMQVNTTGRDVRLSVSDFKIANGEVTIGEIKGEILAGNFLDAQFIIKYTRENGNPRFSGYLDGDLTSIAVVGTLDLTHVKTASDDFYSCYVKLSIATQPGRGVPLAPLPIDIYKLGGEFGYNYRIDFSNSQRDPARPGTPTKNTYIGGLTIGLSVKGGIASLDATPVIQVSVGNTTAVEIALTGQLKVPVEDEWFSADLSVNYNYPANTFSGFINYNLQLPKYNGALIDSRNLGLDFKLYKEGSPQKYYWYLGRKDMQLVLLRVLTLSGDLEFKGPMDDMRLWSAYLRAQSTFRFRWEGEQNVTFMTYEVVRAKAGVDLSASQACSLAVSKEGLSGMMSMDIRAEGYVNIELFPSLNAEWTNYSASILGNVGGSLGFRNTTVSLNGYLQARATVCGETADFRVNLAYTYDPATGGSSSFSGGTSTYTSPPQTTLTYPGENTFRPGDATAIKNFIANKNQNTQQQTTVQSSSGFDRYRTLQAKLTRLKRNSTITAAQYKTFEDNLRTFHTDILVKLNTSTYSTLENFYTHLKGSTSNAAKYKAGLSTAVTNFNTWFTTNGQEDADEANDLLADYPVLRSNLSGFESAWSSAQYNAFKEKLVASGAKVLVKLNGMSNSHNILQSLQLYYTANTGAPAQFASNYAQFEEWLNARSSTDNEQADIFWMSYPNIKKYFTTLNTTLGSSRLNSFLNSLKKCSTTVVASFNTKKPTEAVVIKLCELFEADYTKPASFKATPANFETWYSQNSTVAVAVELADSDLSSVTDPDKESNEATYSNKVTYSSAVVVVIHGSGSTFQITVQGEAVTVNHRTLAAWLEQKGYSDEKILLLSCSDLNAAQNLANKLNQSVIATDGVVQVYSDGGVLGIGENDNVTPWVECLPGNRKNTSVAQPRAPGNTNLDYVLLGRSANVPVPATLTAKISTSGSNTLKAWLVPLSKQSGFTYKSSNGSVYTGTEARAQIYTDLDAMIGDKTVIRVEGLISRRFLITTERGTQSNRVISIEITVSGEYVMHDYYPTYKTNAAPGIIVDLSPNKQAPDYSTQGGTYLYPSSALAPGQRNVVVINMTGTDGGDYSAANEAAGFPGSDPPSLGNGTIKYTWHHLDNYDPVNGTCTMQLVLSSAHTKVSGMAHSGGVAQYKVYKNGQGY